MEETKQTKRKEISRIHHLVSNEQMTGVIGSRHDTSQPLLGNGHNEPKRQIKPTLQLKKSYHFGFLFLPGGLPFSLVHLSSHGGGGFGESLADQLHFHHFVPAAVNEKKVI